MITALGGISQPFYQIQLIYWVILLDDWDGGTIVSTILHVNSEQKNSSLSSVKKTS
jgi:hypothetical protein